MAAPGIPTPGRDPFSDAQSRFSAGRLGIRVFLASLTMLFAASIVGYLVLRIQLGGDAAAPLPPLPRLLWLSTAVLLVSSATIQWALSGIRRGRRAPLRIGITLTFLLGLLFLAIQALCWIDWSGPFRQAIEDQADRAYLLTSFYVMTGLHAAHVIGGLIPMAVVAARALAGRYSAGEHRGVHYAAMYWHFLGGVWLVLYITLLLSM